MPKELATAEGLAKPVGAKAVPLSLHQVSAIQCGRAHADANLMQSWFRLRTLEQLENLRPSSARDDDGYHLG